MHVNTTKSRVSVDESKEVQFLREKVTKLEQQIDDLSKRVPPTKQPPEVKK